VKPARTLFVAFVAGTVAACGLKGPLELPERSSSIVIRGPGDTPAPGTEAPSGTTSTPGTPAPPAKPTKPQPKEERLPPPPLPDGDPGSSRGG
jgi:predicted small lipoprotein YifL